MSRPNTPPQSLPSQSDLAQSTPAHKKSSGFEPHSSTTANRAGRFGDMSSGINEHVVGPMPVKDFLNRFLRPLTSEAVTPVQHEVPTVSAESLQVYAAAKEKYEPLVAALRPIFSNLNFSDSHKHQFIAFHELMISPDVSVTKQGNSLDITKVEIFMELKSSNKDDPFQDDGMKAGDDQPEMKEYFVKNTDSGQFTLGQTTLYAAAHQAAQFRTHIFCYCVGTDPESLSQKNSLPFLSPLFIEFFHLYDHPSPSIRGIDTSVSAPSPENASKACKSLGTSSTHSLVQLSLGGSSNDLYIVSRELYMNRNRSPLGRSTRAFIAYSVHDDCNYFLKDSWRLDSQTPEHEIYRTLHSKNVCHIPTVIGSADILEQVTLTQDILEEKAEWLRAPPKRLRKHKHYRLVLKEIGTTLTSFSSTKLLVTAIRDAMEAHRVAYVEARILHRDISADNIMIYGNGGLLVDWDLSKSKDEKGPRELERTGTWQFMSARLLKEPTALQDRLDDVESFVHVLTWISFRYAGHNMNPEDLGDFMASIFDHSFRHYRSGFAKGGRMKSKYLTNPEELIGTQFKSTNLQNLLQKITTAISIRYAKAPSLENEGVGDPSLLDSLLKSHEKRLAILDDATWMISAFTSALSSPNWLIEDKAEENAIIHPVQSAPNNGEQSSGSKRKDRDFDGSGQGKKLRALTSKSGKGK